MALSPYDPLSALGVGFATEPKRVQLSGSTPKLVAEHNPLRVWLLVWPDAISGTIFLQPFKDSATACLSAGTGQDYIFVHNASLTWALGREWYCHTTDAVGNVWMMEGLRNE